MVPGGVGGRVIYGIVGSSRSERFHGHYTRIGTIQSALWGDPHHIYSGGICSVTFMQLGVLRGGWSPRGL